MSEETMASQTRQHASDDAVVSASRIRNKATKPCRRAVGSWLDANRAETRRRLPGFEARRRDGLQEQPAADAGLGRLQKTPQQQKRAAARAPRAARAIEESP